MQDPDQPLKDIKSENSYCAKSGFKFLDFNAVTEI
jgi:hypothetical protein